MTFDEYLAGKKIDSTAFRNKEPGVWSSWQEEFGQMHPGSFTARKLYLINPTRRKYPMKEQAPNAAGAPPPKPRPVIRPKMN